MQITIKVICKDLPGTEFDDDKNGLHYRNVHLGIQHGKHVIETVPGNSKKAEFAPVFKVEPFTGWPTDDRANFLGLFAQGKKDERFFYLSWGELPGDGLFRMFRRAKIHLSHLTWTQVEKAFKTSEPITLHLSLTDKKGWPLCASVKAPHIKWDI
jgi:hypothetical protein